MRINAVGFSAKGIGRKVNGDAFVIDQTLGFYAVADTVGSVDIDTMPSSLVMEYVRDFIPAITDYRDTDQQYILKDAIIRANEELLRKQGVTLRGHSATTLTCCLVKGAQAFFAHLGDSRAYLIHNHQINQMTKVETLAAVLSEKKLITKAVKQQHPGRNMVLNVLGIQPEIWVTTWSINLLDSNLIVLCTDGVASTLSKEKILKTVTDERRRFRSIARRLVCYASKEGNQDDATAVALRSSLEGSDLKLLGEGKTC